MLSRLSSGYFFQDLQVHNPLLSYVWRGQGKVQVDPNATRPPEQPRQLTELLQETQELSRVAHAMINILDHKPKGNYKCKRLCCLKSSLGIQLHKMAREQPALQSTVCKNWSHYSSNMNYPVLHKLKVN